MPIDIDALVPGTVFKASKKEHILNGRQFIITKVVKDYTGKVIKVISIPFEQKSVDE